MDKEKISGVYKIVDTVNNKVYIGSTYSIEDRWRGHKSSLKTRKGNKGLQNAYDKNGIDSLRIEIIEECDIDSLIKRERFYIRKLNSISADKGYNKVLPYKRTNVPKCKTCRNHIKEYGSHFCTIKPGTNFKILYTCEMQTSPKWCPRRAKLIETDIRLEELERRIERLEGK